MWPPGGRLSHNLSLPSHLANVLATQKPDSSANGFGCFFFFFNVDSCQHRGPDFSGRPFGLIH